MQRRHDSDPAPEPVSDGGRRVILLHVDAPPKPATGADCNGCGACCATDPCPLGVWLSKRFVGACDALQWNDAERRYRCGAAATPERYLRWLPAAVARRLALRWIASGDGCDADIESA